MSVSFDPAQRLILVHCELAGPAGIWNLRLALDTGATYTLINSSFLVALGYDPARVPERVEITTGSSVEYAPLVKVSRITALGHERTGFPVLAHTLPPTATVDGLLGLNFLRGHVLTVDLQKGCVRLEP